MGGWLEPRACLEDVEKTKFLTQQDSKSDLSIIQPVASRYNDCAIPAPINKPVDLQSAFAAETYRSERQWLEQQ
jgi:hypothetical protein